mmetsp:Transcript_24697/g.57973  ORF Transcript_24697/g.57973 Transcript_24697/m.57973 type:complete len:512 (+) Transcript_24697:1-1536(+)
MKRICRASHCTTLYERDAISLNFPPTMVEYDPIGRNAVSSGPSDPRINPAMPDSIGALLAEEWTVNSRSTLPSFFERMLMEEARRSGWEMLRSFFGFLEERISQTVIDVGRQNMNEANIVGGFEETRRVPPSILRRWTIQIAGTFHRTIIQPFGPEIRFLLIYIAERLSLTHSNASITEALYGGTRVKLEESSTSAQYRRNLRPIENHDSVRLAFFLAFGPYLEERSKFLFQYLLGHCSPSCADRDRPGISKRKKKVKALFKMLWPLLQMTSKGAFLWYRWQYFLGLSVFFDPYSRLLNSVVRRTTVEDQQKQDKTLQTSKAKSANIVDSNPNQMGDIRERTVKLLISNRMRWASGGLATFLIALAWVARIRSIRQEFQQERELHELRQVQQHEQQRNRSVQEGTDISVDENYPAFTGRNSDEMIPSPPGPALIHGRITKTAFNCLDHSNSDVCPLCKEPRVHPTASTGGYVFCLKCILEHLRQNGAFCPVTQKACSESSLVRLYEPTYNT